MKAAVTKMGDAPDVRVIHAIKVSSEVLHISVSTTEDDIEADALMRQSRDGAALEIWIRDGQFPIRGEHTLVTITPETDEERDLFCRSTAVVYCVDDGPSVYVFPRLTPDIIKACSFGSMLYLRKGKE